MSTWQAIDDKRSQERYLFSSHVTVDWDINGRVVPYQSFRGVFFLFLKFWGSWRLEWVHQLLSKWIRLLCKERMWPTRVYVHQPGQAGWLCGVAGTDEWGLSWMLLLLSPLQWVLLPRLKYHTAFVRGELVKIRIRMGSELWQLYLIKSRVTEKWTTAQCPWQNRISTLQSSLWWHNSLFFITENSGFSNPCSHVDPCLYLQTPWKRCSTEVVSCFNSPILICVLSL